MATLTGKITDVTSRTPENITSITVKAPSARIGGGTDVIVSSPATANFNRDTGDITISGLTGGLSWLYIEGDGWSDSIPLAVAEGMVTLVEAIANAAGVPGLVDYIELLVGLQARIDDIAQDAVDAAAENIKWDRGVVGAEVTSIDQLEFGSWGVASTTVAANLGLPGTLGNLTVSRVATGKSVLYRALESGTQKHSMWMASITDGAVSEWSKIYPIPADTLYHGIIPSSTASIAELADGEWGVASTTTANNLGLPFTQGTLKIMPIASGKTILGVANNAGTQKPALWLSSISGGTVAEWVEVGAGGGAAITSAGAPGLKTVGVTLTAGSALDGDAGRYRILAQVTAPVTRWRVHIESRRQVFSSTADFTLGTVSVGKHGSNGSSTNSTSLKVGNTSISGSSEWVSRWITNDLSEETLIDFTVSGTGLYSYQAGAYRFNGSTWEPATNVPAAVWIEVETYAETPVVAMIGDSTGAGQGADRPVHDSALHVAGRKHGFIPMNYSYPGSTMESMTNPEHHIYKRWEHLAKPDSVIIQSGSNDIHGGTSTADLQTRFNNLAELARGISPVVFGATVKARYPNSGDFAPALTAHNAYVKTQPAGTRDYLDFYAAVSPNGTVLPADSADAAHLSTSGHAKLAAAFDTVAVARPQVADIESALETKADKAYVDAARWMQSSIPADANYDDLRTPSVRLTMGAGSEAVNPPFNRIGVLEVLPTAYNGIIQRATNWNTLEVWKRQTQGGVFQAWVREPTLADVNAVQDLIPSAESIQDTVDEALSNIDIPGTATDWTRRVPLAVTTGAGPSEGPGSGRYRMKAQFTAPIIRWRLHISTAYTIGGTPGSESTLWLVRVGNHTGDAIMEQPVELMSGSANVPAGGEWVSDWTNHRLDTESIIDVSFTASGSTRNFLAPAWKLDGESWVQTNRAPLWVWIEAETYKDTPTVALIGDSTGAGHGSITPVWDSAAAIAGRKQEFLPVLFASSGDTLSGNVSIDDPNFVRWSDYGTYDSVVIQAGSNDINSGKTLAEVQASFTAVADAAKELGAKVYGATIKPRYPTESNTEVREAYNDWLKTLPAGISGVLDYSTAVAPDGVILPEDNDDGFHLKSSGHHKMAAAYSFPIARPRVVGTWKP